MNLAGAARGFVARLHRPRRELASLSKAGPTYVGKVFVPPRSTGDAAAAMLRATSTYERVAHLWRPEPRPTRARSPETGQGCVRSPLGGLHEGVPGPVVAPSGCGYLVPLNLPSLVGPVKTVL
jgi:hypothetical protein